MDLHNYLKSKSIKELQDLYVYANDYQKSIIKNCIEDKIIINKDEYYYNGNNNQMYYNNLNKFENIMKFDDSNNKLQDRLDINLKDKKIINNNDNNSLGKRKNF